MLYEKNMVKSWKKTDMIILYKGKADVKIIWKLQKHKTIAAWHEGY